MSIIGRYAAAWLALAGSLALAGEAAAGQADEVAVRRFETALGFVANGQYREALNDFEGIIELYPASPVADNALLEIARYHLEVSEQLDRAAEYASRIVDDATYAQRDAAPEAYVLLARAAIARGYTETNLEAALAELQRGLGVWPDAPVVPQTLFYMGEAHRFAGRRAEALESYGRVTAEHATSQWAARASLSAGLLHAAAGDPFAAMTELQQVRDGWPDTPEAAIALERITILYRLYVRSPDRAFLPGGEPFGTRGLPRVEEVVVDRDGRVFFATESGVGGVDPAAAAMLPGRGRPRGLFLDRRGVVTAAVRGTLISSTEPPRELVVPRPGEDPKRLEEIDAVGLTAAGDWLVADGDERVIHRFSPAGEYRGEFVAGRARHLAVGPDDEIAIVDRDNRIHLMAEGRTLGELPRRGDGYEIDDPVDLVYDVFGHLYVADERRVYVFGLDRRLLLQFPVVERAPGAPRRISAFAVDGYGRLVVADDDEHQILTYR